jgi:biopolymer transport protein ExbB
MKSIASVLLALVLTTCSILAQTPAVEGPRLTPPPAKENASAVSSIDDARAGQPLAKPAPAPAKGAAAYIPKEQPPTPAVTRLWNMIENGGWAMVPLAVMSVLCVMLTLIFLATLRRSAILTPHYMNTADVLLKKRDYLGLLAISSRHSEAVARVVQRTLDFATKNPSASFDIVKGVAESEGSAQAASFQHRVTYLADIGTLSPMVGLLGTVFGIVKSFGEIGTAISGQAGIGVMGKGVSEALIATGGGLVIGIMAFTFYAYFRNKVQRLISDLEVASAHVIGLMALNFKKREPSRAAIDEEF